jgi:YVTN family beta-propeller protein
LSEASPALLRVVAVVMAAATCISTAPLLAAENYSVQATWKLGGDGGWDYLTMDPDAHLLYITRGNRVMVVDVQAGKLAAEIPGFEGIHGVALDSAGKYGYVSDGRANMVRVFDRGTRQVVASIPVDQGPDSIVFEPVLKYVFSMNGQGKSTSVIDTASNKVIATIPLPGRPEATAADGKGNVFVNIEDKSELARIDAATFKVTGTWSLAPCDGPSGFAIDPVSRRAFSVCDGKTMAVTDLDTGKVVATPAIGQGPDAAGFDPQHGLVYSSNGQDGTLTILHQDSPDSYSLVQTVPTKRGARTMALDPSTGKLYLVTADFGPRPAPTADNPRPRPPILPGTFTVLVVGK